MTYAQFCKRWPLVHTKPYRLQRADCGDGYFVSLYESFDIEENEILIVYEIVVHKNKTAPRLIACISAFSNLIQAIDEAERAFNITVKYMRNPA